MGTVMTWEEFTVGEACVIEEEEGEESRRIVSVHPLRTIDGSPAERPG